MANVFDSNDLQVVKELKELLEQLRIEFTSLQKTIIQTQVQLSKQAKSQSDLKKNTEQLTTVEKELQKLDNIINEASLKIYESLNKKPKELTYKQTLRVFKAIPIEKWSEI